MEYVDYKKIKGLRTEKKFTLKEMAAATNYESATGYYHAENGDVLMTVDKLSLIADKLGCKVRDLINDEEAPNA